MTDLTESFNTAASDVQKLSKRPDNEVMLQLYGLYKQATLGDVRGKRPGMLDMVGRAKFDAWSSRKGLDQQAAMEQYIALVESLKQA